MRKWTNQVPLLIRDLRVGTGQRGKRVMQGVIFEVKAARCSVAGVEQWSCPPGWGARGLSANPDPAQPCLSSHSVAQGPASF